CRTYRIARNRFGIILTQGLNRQIRRMCEYFGYRVVRLKRIRVLNLTLKDLPSGKYREATGKELLELKEKLYPEDR
ncbi:MAG: 23S rRNA pseudouridine synthase F, partial [Blautia sp.]|nr:23S rRNA pseudouridine synthase F [Blautia sp.]